MLTREFLARAVERALRAAAWAVISVLTVADGFNAFHANWVDALGVGLGAAVLSLLGSVAASQVGDPTSPSFVDDTPGKHAAPEGN